MRDFYAEAVAHAEKRWTPWSPWKLRNMLRSERIAHQLTYLKFREWVDAWEQAA